MDDFVSINLQAVTVFQSDEGSEDYYLGQNGVTGIKTTQKPGEYSRIPYIEVYKDGKLYAEFNQHKVVGVYHILKGDPQ